MYAPYLSAGQGTVVRSTWKKNFFFGLTYCIWQEIFLEIPKYLLYGTPLMIYSWNILYKISIWHNFDYFSAIPYLFPTFWHRFTTIVPSYSAFLKQLIVIIVIKTYEIKIAVPARSSPNPILGPKFNWNFEFLKC